jgi:hypothetical protein
MIEVSNNLKYISQKNINAIFQWVSGAFLKTQKLKNHLKI